MVFTGGAFERLSLGGPAARLEGILETLNNAPGNINGSLATPVRDKLIHRCEVRRRELGRIELTEQPDSQAAQTNSRMQLLERGARERTSGRQEWFECGEREGIEIVGVFGELSRRAGERLRHARSKLCLKQG